MRNAPALHGRDHLPGGSDPIPGLDVASSLAPIFDTILSSDTTSVTTPSIPAIYRNLMIYVSLRSTRVNPFDLATMRINSDSGANYVNEFTTMTFTTVSANADLTATSAYWGIPASQSNSLFWGSGLLNVFDYLAAHAKLMLIDSYYLKTVSGNTEAVREVGSSGWVNDDAITTLTFATASAQIAAGSRISVYALG